MSTIHQCECEICQQPEYHLDQTLHRQMNLLLSRLDEQQRRWYAALEAKKRGHGGATQVAEISGLHVPAVVQVSVETIRRGRTELENGLADRPVDRVRKAGGGRKPVEKKSQRSKPS